MPHDSRGREIPDPIPVEVPIQWRRPPTIQEQIKQMVRRELSQSAAAQGLETFEDADDFDIPDDPPDPLSEWETTYEQQAAFDADRSLSGSAGVQEGRGENAPRPDPVPPVQNRPDEGRAGQPGTGAGNSQQPPAS